MRLPADSQQTELFKRTAQLLIVGKAQNNIADMFFVSLLTYNTNNTIIECFPIEAASHNHPIMTQSYGVALPLTPTTPRAQVTDSYCTYLS